tara:strand:- start:854 stop:1699 length:846 start_codon:yes stop_codon:yes gene_type:complete
MEVVQSQKLTSKVEMHAPVATEDVAIETVNVTKSFGQLQVLHGVSMKFRRGEVTALIGDNGAGKSTFLKCLSGEYSPSGGTISFDGKPVTLRSAIDARELGLEMVYQDLALSPDIPVVENMFLGREIMKGGLAGKLGVIDKKSMHDETVEILRDLGINLKNYNAPTLGLSGGQRQAIAVARAMKWATGAVLLDEPTAALGARQRALVYKAIREAADRNLAVVLVSHDLPQVMELADRINVLRQGVNVGHFKPKDVSLRDIIDVMLGDSIEKKEGNKIEELK